MTFNSSLGGDGWNPAIAETDLYTWAGKPPANSVPVGKRIRISDFYNSDWISDGTNWRPKGGHVVICRANLSAYTTTATSQTQITIGTADLPVIPFNDLMTTPGFRITTYFTAQRFSIVSGAPMIVCSWRPGDGSAIFARTAALTNSNALLSATGDVEFFDANNTKGATGGLAAYYNGNYAPPLASPPSAPFSRSSQLTQAAQGRHCSCVT